MLKVINETKWRTSDLKALFNAVAKHEGLQPNHLRVKIVPSRVPTQFIKSGGIQSLVGGTAWRYSNIIKMRLPNVIREACYGSDGRFSGIKTVELNEFNEEQTKIIGQVFLHELDHIRGIHDHKDMIEWWNRDIPYINGMIVKKNEEVKIEHDLKVERKAHAEKMLREAESKAKRWAKRAKVWQRKVKYYEKVKE